MNTNSPLCRWPQLSLRTLLFCIAVAGVWLADVANRREAERLKLQVERLRPIARELVVWSPEQLVINRIDPLRGDDFRWDLHVPSEGFGLAIATQGIDEEGCGEKQFPEPARVIVLPAGRVRIELAREQDDSGVKARALLNGHVVLEVSQPYQTPVKSQKSDLVGFRESQHEDPDERVTLHRQWRKDHEPGLGLLLWIEPPPNTE